MLEFPWVGAVVLGVQAVGRGGGESRTGTHLLSEGVCCAHSSRVQTRAQNNCPETGCSQHPAQRVKLEEQLPNVRFSSIFKARSKGRGQRDRTTTLKSEDALSFLITENSEKEFFHFSSILVRIHT